MRDLWCSHTHCFCLPRSKRCFLVLMPYPSSVLHHPSSIIDQEGGDLHLSVRVSRSNECITCLGFDLSRCRCPFTVSSLHSPCMIHQGSGGGSSLGTALVAKSSSPAPSALVSSRSGGGGARVLSADHRDDDDDDDEDGEKARTGVCFWGKAGTFRASRGVVCVD